MVWFGSASRRLGDSLGRSQGLLRHVDVEGVAWGVMWNTISLSFNEVSYIYWGLVFPQNNYWLALVYHLQVLWLHLSHFISQEYSQRALRVIQQPPVLIYPILYLTISATHHRTLPITPHSFYNTNTPITTHYNTYNDPSNSQCTQKSHTTPPLGNHINT